MQIGQWSGDDFGLKLPSTLSQVVNVPNLTDRRPRAVSPQKITPLPPITQIGGTCYAFAVTNFFRYASPALPLRSGLALGWLAQKILGVADDYAGKQVLGGGYARCAMGAAMAYGMPSEANYRDIAENAGLKPDVEALMGAFDARLAIESVHQLRVHEAQALASIGVPSIIGLPVYDEVYASAKDGRELTGSGYYVGGHYWLLVDRNTLQSTWGACGRDGMGLFQASDDYLSNGFDIWTGVPRWMN